MKIIPKDETLTLEEIAKLWFSESEAAAIDLVIAGYSSKDELSAFSKAIERNDYMQCLSLLSREVKEGRLKAKPVFGHDTEDGAKTITGYKATKESFIEWHKSQAIVLDTLSPVLSAWGSYSEERLESEESPYAPMLIPDNFKTLCDSKPKKQEWFLREWIRMHEETKSTSDIFDGKEGEKWKTKRGIKRLDAWEALYTFTDNHYSAWSSLFNGGGMDDFFKKVGTKHIKVSHH